MKVSRREFLKRTGQAVGAATLASQINHLGAMTAFAANPLAEPLGYKALVLIFLAGGNDGNNTVVPLHDQGAGGTISTYTQYAAARGTDLTLPANSLIEISVPRMGGRSYGLHPSLGPIPGGNPGIAELFGESINGAIDRKLAIVANVGTLVKPLAGRAGYLDPTKPKPYQLFSHSDQIDQNQSGHAGTIAYTGWGGRVGDTFAAGTLPNSISIAGSQLFLMGSASPLAVGDANTPLQTILSLEPAGYPAARKTALLAMIDEDAGSANKYIDSAADTTKLALEADTALQSATFSDLPFPATGIGQQLKQVAKIIQFSSNTPALNIHRQVFCCVLGGFDTHADQVPIQAVLLTQLSQAMRAFFDAMLAINRSSEVTTFTQSDFGRTLDPTGSGQSAGSDHAWGNHMFVMGGSVIGGDFFGFNSENGTPFPSLVKMGIQDTDTRGRWVPSTSIDQYGATLASWFGLNSSQIATVFPNIGLGYFPNTNVGFFG